MPEWTHFAACRTHSIELFFPEKKNDPRISFAKRICSFCPVRSFCLRHALEHEEVGVWGGTTEEDRFRMLALFGPNLVQRLEGMHSQRAIG